MKKNHIIQNGDAMSGNEPTGARRRHKSKVAVWLGVAGICATGASLVPVGSHTQAAPGDPVSEGMECADSAEAGGVRTFNLVAADGYISTPDGNGIYNWGYGEAGSGFQLPGPVLCANTGETVVVNLANQLPVATSITFPGQDNVLANGIPDGPAVDGTNNLVALATEAGPGGTVQYSFTATREGTYLYESGSDPQLQVEMGLFGALVIRPSGITITAQDIRDIPWEDGGAPGLTNASAGLDLGEATPIAETAKCAYASVTTAGKCDLAAIYDGAADRENILMLHQIDPGLHTFIEQNLGDPTLLNWKSYPNGYVARYFLINGRSMPDTVAPNNAPWLPGQPYGSLAHVQPWDPNVNPLDAMIRYVAVGPEGYDFHPHSNHEHVIGADGALMKDANGDDNTEGKFNIMVAPGSTVDATFRWTNQEGYSETDGNLVPVAWPQGLNLQEGDFWSGSPYLGDSGVLNPGILTHTQCGEYYHVAHNHDLTQATNYGATFGGMLTLIKVEPPDSVQAQLGPCDSLEQ
ncbi:MAG: multicopper oxidase domain-containing protein [Ilumatobacteraceae bacterium]